MTLLPFVPGLLSRQGDLPGVPADAPPIPGDSDVYEHAWHFWWVGRALGTGVDPRLCPLIGPPPGASVISKNIGWPDAAAFGLAAGEHAAEALWAALVSGALLAFLGGWAFARAWGLRGPSAATAAFIFAWAPCRVSHVIQHYQIACAGWDALSLACIKFWIDGGRRRLLPAAALCTAAAGLESPYHLLFTGLGALATFMLSGRRAWARVPAAAAAAASGAALAGAFFLTAPGGLPGVSVPWQETFYYAAEPQSFLLPSPFGIAGLLLRIPARFPWMPNTFEGVATVGASVLLLSIVSLRRAPMRVMLLASLAFCALALGPMLKFRGNPYWVPLPFRLLQAIPSLAWVRAPSRFVIPAELFASVPAAWALHSLRRPARGFAGALVFLELFVPRIPSVSGRIPSFYREAGDRTAVTLEVPASPMILRYSLFQTADSRPRPVYFVPREVPQLPAGIEPFSLGSDVAVDSGDAVNTGVDIIVYNRWLLDAPERARYDSLYSGLFGMPEPGDSVLVWRRS